MALYMYQLAYTPEAWAAQIKSPQDMRVRVAAAAEKLDGRLISAWYCFGEYDLVAILEYPDNVGVAAASMLVSAGGALKAVKTTPLLTIENGIDAMKMAGEAAGVYSAPTG